MVSVPVLGYQFALSSYQDDNFTGGTLITLPGHASDLRSEFSVLGTQYLVLSYPVLGTRLA